MATINNKLFSYFNFSHVFDSKRGRRLIEQNHISGNIAYISSSAQSNGLDNYISPPDFMPVYANKMTISNSGSVGYCFYHDYEFVASDHVTVFWPKSIVLNRYIALYLKPVFEKIRYRYSFGREISDERLAREKIYLPIDENGDPDWEYMQIYTRALEETIDIHTIKTITERKSNAVSTSEWKEYKLIGQNGLFDYQHGSRLTVANRLPGDVPLITAGQKNQGYAQSVGNSDIDIKFEKGVTVDMFSNAFYQNFAFAADDNIYIFNQPQNMNKYVGIFLVTVLKQQKYKYGFGRQFRKDDAARNRILLPSNDHGTPDWDYMENFIKSLSYAEYLDY